ncbi:FAD-dependent oxidoreductase [Aeromicrobium sp. CFBP 8757]|uniref:ferredoxin--NADP reductase n=1 Tax=Aeromicrobium sp. CFBP 8757 TaxID=2775288 RepID=UPI00177AF23A|nr:FAD-dependent oxidoreductase [Aeromicrobium sp. CFBP 8757]
MAHQKVDIELRVLHVRAETPQHLSIVFERPRGFDYEAGDWIDLAFADELRGGRTYSLSSSPTEPDLMITFKEGQSEVKRALAGATPGDRMRITAYGNDYEFQLAEHRDSVLIAGGVGVAPFRSMMKEMVDARRSGSLELVYLNGTDDFLFKDELDAWQAELPDARVDYIVTKGLKRKDRERMLREIISVTAHLYYVAGAEGMIESTEALLDTMGVDHDDIRIDSFGGY